MNRRLQLSQVFLMQGRGSFTFFAIVAVLVAATWLFMFLQLDIPRLVLELAGWLILFIPVSRPEPEELVCRESVSQPGSRRDGDVPRPASW